MADNLPVVTTSERSTFKRTGRPVTSHTPSAQSQRCGRARGIAKNHQCVRCPKRALDWAHVHGESGDDPWADFVPLCRSCHMNYDNSESRWGDTEYRERLSKALSDRAIKQWSDPEQRRRMSVQPKGFMSAEARSRLGARSKGNQYAAGIGDGR
jgi:hypothetical protein